jgi:hypothetical protein
VAPFTRLIYGTPFDTPEAEIRRTGGRSATEVLLTKHDLEKDPKLQLLGGMTHLYEITPWLLPSDRPAHALGQQIREQVADCGSNDIRHCMERVSSFLDNWYENSEKSP